MIENAANIVILTIISIPALVVIVLTWLLIQEDKYHKAETEGIKEAIKHLELEIAKLIKILGGLFK